MVDRRSLKIKLFDDDEVTDKAYINIKNGLYWLSPPDLARTHVEELYSETKHLLDKKFHKQLKYDFYACYAEMYFAAALQSRCGYHLTHPSDKGLDFYIPELNCWVEVVNATDGEPGKVDSIPPIVYKQYSGYPEDKVILRLANAISVKFKKIRSDLERHLLNPDQPIVLCLSGGGLSERIPMYPEGGFPQIVKALLPVGDLKLWLARDSRQVVSKEFVYKGHVHKSNGSTVSTECFLDEANRYISAVIFSYANPGMPVERSQRGCDFYTVHNPLAANPLPNGFITCGLEYTVRLNEELVIINPPISHERNET